MSASSMLEVRALRKSFGGLTAIKSASFHVAPKEICSIVGPNGAGKTTLINLITGVYGPDSGDVLFQGRRLTGLRPNQVVSQGIGRTFQNLRVFGNMNVLENVMTGSHRLLHASLLDIILSLPRARSEDSMAREKSLRALEVVGLAGRDQQPAGSLPLGMQRLLELARALVSEPSLLLLDEPASGLNDAETAALGRLLRRIRDEGVTILLIEHNMPLVMGISDRIVVLNYGEKIAEGTPPEIRSNPAVIAAYLGEEAVAHD